MRRVIVEDGVVVTGEGRVAEGATVLVEDGRIAAILDGHSRIEPRPGDWRIPADGRLVTAGLVDAYAALPDPPERAAARLVDAALRGVTTLVATASEAACPPLGDLAVRLGLRLFLAPWSPEAAPVADTVLAIAARAPDARGRLRPAVAVPEAALAGPDVLDAGRSLARSLDAPLVLPVAEDDEALSQSFARFDARPVERLDALGLLDPRTILVHGDVLDTGELDATAAAGSVLCVVPHAAPDGLPSGLCGRARARGATLALGTGDRGGSPLGEIVIGAARGDLPDALEAALAGGAAVVEMALGAGAGRLVPGAPADLVVHGWRPDRPVDGTRWAGAVPWGAAAAWSLVGGEVVLREGRLLGVDARAVAGAAREA